MIKANGGNVEFSGTTIELMTEYAEKLKAQPNFFIVKPLGINPNEATAMKKELGGQNKDGGFNDKKLGSYFESIASKKNISATYKK